MPKKSARVVLTLLGSAAIGVGCSQAPPEPPADSFASQVDFEKEPGDKPEGDIVGQTGIAPTTGAGQSSQSQSPGHSSHYYHRGPSMWPLLFWGMSRPSAPTHQPGTPSSVPRGPAHANHASTATTPGHSTSTHATTTHSGSTSHVSSRGFGSTGHAISGGS